jgi:chromosome segregation ATPase
MSDALATRDNALARAKAAVKETDDLKEQLKRIPELEQQLKRIPELEQQLARAAELLKAAKAELEEKGARLAAFERLAAAPVAPLCGCVNRN